MIALILSGGQTGADQAGWRAAKACGIATAGRMPLGFRAEDGDHPEFAELYGATEDPSREYWPRTTRNVCDSDATVYFVHRAGYHSPGLDLTAGIARREGRPILVLAPGDRGFRAWLGTHRPRVLNVAGNRASTAGPEFGPRVEAYLIRAFRCLSGSGS